MGSPDYPEYPEQRTLDKYLGWAGASRHNIHVRWNTYVPAVDHCFPNSISPIISTEGPKYWAAEFA